MSSIKIDRASTLGAGQGATAGLIDAALELRIRAIIQGMDDACILLDSTGKFLEANLAASELLGYAASEFPALSLEDGVFIPEANEDLRDCLAKQGYRSGRLTAQTKAGHLLTCHYKAWNLVVPGISSIVLTDISEQRRMEEVAVEKERQFSMEQQRFSNMFRDAPVSMCILMGRDLVFQKTNAVFDQLVPKKNLIGRPVREALPEIEQQGLLTLLEEVYATGKPVSQEERRIRFEADNGEKKEVYLNFMYQPFRNADGEVEGIFYFGVDVTEQVIARKRVEESEKRYRQIVETAQEGIWLLDKDHNTLFVNQKMCEILQLPVSQIAGRNISDFLDTSDDDSAVRLARSQEGSMPSTFELRLRSTDGRPVWAHLNTTRIVDSGGLYGGLLAMVTDITKRKSAEEELKKLSLIAHRTTNSIFITRANQTIEWVNEAFTRITGYTAEEVLDKKPSMLFGPETDQAVAGYIAERKNAFKAFTCQILKYKKNGTPFWVEVEGHPVFDAKGELSYYFNMETDITDRKQAYQKLLKTESQVRTFARQLNNMLEDERARLAREIHDEFGQQLMGLKMSLSYLETMDDLPAEGRTVIRELLSGLETTFQALKNFSTELRPGILDTLGLAPSVEWLARSFEKKSGIPCAVEMKVRQQMFGKDLSNTCFRVCQEALTNVLKHAEAKQVTIRLIQDAQSLLLEVADDGKGMHSEKVENPFSLGLLGMQERARLIEGNLEIFSAPGKGTRIRLTANIDAR